MINHNLLAVRTAHYLTKAMRELGTSVARLSSGLRITQAADDPAALVIRDMMRGEIATLHQGVRNVSDAVSMIQTADGALAVIDEKLVRMKELATQAATGTYSSSQRVIIDSEYQAMASEITRIANATDFNGILLLNGNLSSSVHDGSGLVSTGKLKVHFGTNNDSAEDYYYIQIGSATAADLGVGGNAPDKGGSSLASGAGRHVTTQAQAQYALDAISDAILSKDSIRANLGALQNRLENTLTHLEIQADRLQAAESRISDSDVAQEMMNFVRAQILTQSATAMLSQANTLPNIALRLLNAA